MTVRSAPIVQAAAALFGPLVWAAHFIVVYASESVLCQLASGSAHTALVAVAAVIALGATGADLLAQRRSIRDDGAPRFLSQARQSLDALAIIAITWGSVVGLSLPACR